MFLQLDTITRKKVGFEQERLRRRTCLVFFSGCCRIAHYYKVCHTHFDDSMFKFKKSDYSFIFNNLFNKKKVKKTIKLFYGR